MKFEGPLEVVLAGPVSFSSLDLSVDCNDNYRNDALTDAGWRELARIAPTRTDGMVRHVIALETPVLARRIRITPLSGDGAYSAGHLALT